MSAIAAEGPSSPPDAPLDYEGGFSWVPELLALAITLHQTLFFALSAAVPGLESRRLDHSGG